MLESSVQSTRLELYYCFFKYGPFVQCLKKNMDILEPNFQDQKKLQTETQVLYKAKNAWSFLLSEILIR